MVRHKFVYAAFIIMCFYFLSYMFRPLENKRHIIIKAAQTKLCQIIYLHIN
jgi:hypothetical protein